MAFLWIGSSRKGVKQETEQLSHTMRMLMSSADQTTGGTMVLPTACNGMHPSNDRKYNTSRRAHLMQQHHSGSSAMLTSDKSSLLRSSINTYRKYNATNTATTSW